jgi:bifunctional DNA-binding transcriptional regulator/antitoxin component of YhaV-PrlF toxin-antitoxin module
MIVEVNEAGEILIPAELVRAAPRTRLEADREGDLVVLKPLAPDLRDLVSYLKEYGFYKNASVFHIESWNGNPKIISGSKVS